MLQIPELNSVLNAISAAVLVAHPLYDDSNEIVNFNIDYTNAQFSAVTKGQIEKGMKLSAFEEKLSSELAWLEMVKQVVLSKNPCEKSFYSLFLGKWLKININSMENNSVVLTLTDISAEKENEMRLVRQNSRLASLTEELSVNRTDLKNKLENIQTLNSQLQFAAYHDTMTNLYNRAWFTKYAQQVSAKALADNSKFGILLLDMDNLKNINDSLGHDAGDEFIRKTATIMRSFESDSVTAFRFGSDEFILLVNGISKREDMQDFSSKVLSEFNANNMGFSAGIAVYPDDSKDPFDLLKFADMAKAEVKKNGKNNFCFFHQIMQEKFLNKMNIETKLRKALNDNAFQLYFQPQFDVETGVLRGFEALIRWHDDELGWISPETFIPLAEESRLVIPIGDWVMETALETLAKWEKDYNFTGLLSVNVSSLQLKTPDFIDKLKEKVEKYKINVKHLELEITESLLIDNVDEAVKKLNVVREMGIGISLDDFGTGYSSLRYLQILPLTTLKIDKSFISNINDSNANEANITETILSLVSKMGLDSIAEGVETDAQLSMLKKINCQSVQGFLKGKPMPKDLCERVLRGDSSALLTL